MKHNSWKNRDYWLLKIQHEPPLVNCCITLLWIPSHCDVDGNEKADDLAKLGSQANQSNVRNKFAKPRSKVPNGPQHIHVE